MHDDYTGKHRDNSETARWVCIDRDVYETVYHHDSYEGAHRDASGGAA